MTPVQAENSPFKSRLSPRAGHSYLDPHDPRASGGKPVASNAAAADKLASGPKSAPAPVHESMQHGGDGEAGALKWWKGQDTFSKRDARRK
jgi:hypothetical protein